MKMRFIGLLTACLLVVTGLFAKDMESGVDYLLVGDLERAEKILKECPEDNLSLLNFYLGEVATKNGDFASAKSYFEKGLEADPENVLNEVGLARVQMETNKAEGLNKLNELMKARSNRRNSDMFVAIARIYHELDMTSEYEEALALAERANRRSPQLSMLKGDVYKDEKKIGQAASEYGQAILQDRNCNAAYVKIAQLYLNVNPSYAIERLEELLQINPNCGIAYKYLAKAYYNNTNYEKAIETYNKFYYEGHDLDDMTSYAASLFFSKKYDEAMKLINEGMEEDPDNFVLNRLMMYSALETNSTDEGIESAEKFFQLPREEYHEYILRDYTTYADLLVDKGEYDKAALEIDKAVEIADNSIEIENIIRSASEEFYSNGAFVLAADFIQKLIDYKTEQGDEVDPMDYFSIGQYLYRASTSVQIDSTDVEGIEARINNLERADVAFAKVEELSPHSHLGSLYRARTNALLDPETLDGVAKPHYEKTAEIVLESDEPDNRVLIEAYSYLSYYHYLQFVESNDDSERQTTLEYSRMMLELDAENPIAKQFIDALDY